METKITGKILVLDNNIDTDQIYPGRYLAITDPKEIGSHCLSGIDESLAGKFPQGGIVVAGRNFGCGSSREHVVCKGLSQEVADGQTLTLDLENGTVKVEETGKTYTCERLGDQAMKILEAGGIKPLMRARLGK